MFLEKNECDSLPCENNSTCVDDQDGYTCHCTEHWLGDNCTGIFNTLESTSASVWINGSGTNVHKSSVIKY